MGIFLFATSFLLGLFVRVAGFCGGAVALVLWLGLYGDLPGDTPVWRWSPVLVALLCGTCTVFAAGRALGADAWIRRNVAAVRNRRGLGIVLRLMT